MNPTLTRPTDTGDAGTPSDAVVTEVLEVLLEHAELGDAVPTFAVVERIPVGDADVVAAIVRLGREGALVEVGGRLELSDAGRRRAVTAVRRHRLTERLLADVLALDWWKVHHEAARWEGVLSDDTESRVVDLLGDPGTCPHGNPIPGSANRPRHADASTLAQAPIGPVHVVRITETLEGDDEALQLLQACGFLPGRDAELKARRDGWCEVAGTVHDAALPPHVAAHTYVVAH